MIKRRVFWVQNRKFEHCLVPHIQISQGTKFDVTKFAEKKYSSLKQKNKHHHQIQRIQINLGT